MTCSSDVHTQMEEHKTEAQLLQETLNGTNLQRRVGCRSMKLTAISEHQKAAAEAQKAAENTQKSQQEALDELTKEKDALAEKFTDTELLMEEKSAVWQSKQTQMEEEIKVLHEANQGTNGYGVGVQLAADATFTCALQSLPKPAPMRMC